MGARTGRTSRPAKYPRGAALALLMLLHSMPEPRMLRLIVIKTMTCIRTFLRQLTTERRGRKSPMEFRRIRSFESSVRIPRNADSYTQAPRLACLYLSTAAQIGDLCN